MGRELPGGLPSPNRVRKSGKSGFVLCHPRPLCCIIFNVTGPGLVRRVLLVTLVAAGLLTFLGATAHASPIRPDIKKLLAQPPVPMPQYVPARAGWNGPEIATSRTAPNPTFESLSPAATDREVRATLFATMMPDLRILALLALVILLLRRIRRYEQMPATSALGANGSTATLPDMNASAAAACASEEEKGEARPAA